MQLGVGEMVDSDGQQHINNQLGEALPAKPTGVGQTASVFFNRGASDAQELALLQHKQYL